MNKYLQFISVLFLGLLGIYILSSILNFFSIPLENYITYLLFVLCMTLLYYILPKEKKSVIVQKIEK